MFKRIFPLVLASVAASAWHPLTEFLEQTFAKDDLLGHLLQSPVNVISISLAAAVLGFIIVRFYEVFCESGWQKRALLPMGEQDFTSYDSVEQFSLRLSADAAKSRRPLRLLDGCFQAVQRDWSRQAAQDALDAKYKLLQDELATRYRTRGYLVGAIATTGFFGTMLGSSQAMRHIQDASQATIQLHVAFDTTLVALLLGGVVGYLLAGLRSYDDTVLTQAYDNVFQHFVQRIRQRRDA